MVDTLQSAREFFQQLFAGGSGQTAEEANGRFSLDFILDGFKALSVVGAGLSFFTSPGEFVTAIVARISRFTSFVSGYSLVIIVLLFFC
jgi:hypothetical protein